MFGLSAVEMLEASEKIKSFIPKIREFIPKAKLFEEAEAKKLNLSKEEMLLYSVLFSNTKIYLYVFRCFVPGKEFDVNGKKFASNSVIITDQLKKIELTAYLDRIENEGLAGLISEFSNFKID